MVVLTRVKPFRGPRRRLVSPDQPSEVCRRAIQPGLDIRRHLGRTPGIGTDTGDARCRADTGGEVRAGCRPESRVVEAMNPGRILGGGRGSLTWLLVGIRSPLPPAGDQGQQLRRPRRVVRGSRHVKREGNACNRRASRDVPGYVKRDDAAVDDADHGSAREEVAPRSVADESRRILVQCIVFARGDGNRRRARRCDPIRQR